jgi:hypothetical protein
MTDRKLCGYDVNGWRDSVARNWVARPGDEEDFSLLRIVEGAILPDVVRAGSDKDSQWIGGIQADLAPHGRGGGWGTFGGPERRRTVRSLIQDTRTAPEVLASAFTGLAHGANYSVVAVEDSERSTEPVQEHLLAALARARTGKSLLVWRSVLAVLHALQSDILGNAAREGALVGIIGHSADGFSLQTLRLRSEVRGGSRHLAPERRQIGAILDAPLGYEGLVAAASRQIADLASDQRSDHLLSARAIGRLAFGLKTRPEPLRRANGSWDILTPPESVVLPLCDLGSAWASPLHGCDAVLFETLTEGPVRSALFNQLKAAVRTPLVLLPTSSAAEGALIAAKRQAAGHPVYFDFLPRIATIVQGADGAISYDLVGEAETLPAGSLYRSPKPARFALMAGRDRFQVYLKKETHREPRRALVEVGAHTSDDTPIDLWVEQMPAAGRAKILMQAPTLSRQFTVDWDAAEVLDQTWEGLLSEMATPLPTVPRRLILPCGMHGWHDSAGGSGLLSLLDENDTKTRPDWDGLATKLASRPFGQYCISSDGQVPDEVPKASLAQLDSLTDRALLELQQINSGNIQPDTAPLRFLTWQFRRCPTPVAVMLLEAWEARRHGRDHRFANSAQAWVLIRQGLGRILFDSEHEERAVTLLMQTPMNSWRYREETAAAAFLLSRSDDCPKFLERADVERLSTRLVEEFNANLGSEYTKFHYAPFLLVGLLRWRLKSPRSLVLGMDPIAEKMAAALTRVENDMKTRRRRLPKIDQVAQRWLPLLEQTLDELRGSGRNPDLLAAIYAA